MHRVSIIFALLMLSAAFVVAADKEAASKEPGKPLKSGLQVGDIVGTFDVEDVTGPARGRSICYACRYGTRPVVNIFAREMTDEVATLITKIDKQIDENQDKELKAFVVLLSEDPKADEETLIKLTRKHRIKNVPLTLFDGAIGPPKCRISEKAAVTVMLWHDQEVKANHAFAKGKLTRKGIEAVVKSAAKILK
ncbi:MAG: hypothetical protein H8E37_07790 [Planctomycetes bacterium]|nr:hypothetical protein [Planctomycetota bacterium]